MRHSMQKTLMIIDDYPENLKVLQEMLEVSGYRVVAFPSGPLALRAAYRNPPDLILLDIKMPDMDGFEVCQKLKADTSLKDIPVLFISALDQVQDKIRAFSQGGADYITKPFHPEEVHARVTSHLASKSLQDLLYSHSLQLEETVRERTRELIAANKQLQNMQRLKNSFLRMLSHELRTPVNGLLGISQVLLDICPMDNDLQQLRENFFLSRKRLNNLIEDASTIAGMDSFARDGYQRVSIWEYLDAARNCLQKVSVTVDREELLKQIYTSQDMTLFNRTMETILRLGLCFSSNRSLLQLFTEVDGQNLALKIHLDNLELTARETETFFHMDSEVRGYSAAQDLALAPVVAHEFLLASGGGLRLFKEENRTGWLEASIKIETGKNKIVA